MITEYEALNIEKYKSPLGPTAEQLRADGKSWKQIIEGSAPPGGSDLNLAPPGFFLQQR
jgi:hypothetical protein